MIAHRIFLSKISQKWSKMFDIFGFFWGLFGILFVGTCSRKDCISQEIHIFWTYGRFYFTVVELYGETFIIQVRN